jgi:hypothetical protein
MESLGTDIAKCVEGEFSFLFCADEVMRCHINGPWLK